jgi:hypothetical protein
MNNRLINRTSSLIEHSHTGQQKDDQFAQQLSASSIDCRKPLVSYEEFVNELLNHHRRY